MGAVEGVCSGPVFVLAWPKGLTFMAPRFSRRQPPGPEGHSIQPRAPCSAFYFPCHQGPQEHRQAQCLARKTQRTQKSHYTCGHGCMVNYTERIQIEIRKKKEPMWGGSKTHQARAPRSSACGVMRTAQCPQQRCLTARTESCHHRSSRAVASRDSTGVLPAGLECLRG